MDKVEGTVLYVQTTESESFPSAYAPLSASYLEEATEVKKGTVLEITCDGWILETYPEQFGKVKKVKVISSPGEEDATEVRANEAAMTSAVRPDGTIPYRGELCGFAYCILPTDYYCFGSLQNNTLL